MTPNANVFVACQPRRRGWPWCRLRAINMDHVINNHAEFTRWVVRKGFSRNHARADRRRRPGRRKPTGDYLTVHGFDPIEEVVQQLTETNRRRSNRHYHFTAVGNSDGEMRLYFNPANPTASSIFPQGASRYGVETVEQAERAGRRAP